MSNEEGTYEKSKRGFIPSIGCVSTDRKVPGEKKQKLTELCSDCSEKSGLRIELITDDEAVFATKRGPFTKVDLGIAKYNFEAVSGHKCR